MSWAVWITGPPGSGKSTIARAVETELHGLGTRVKRLELDEIRKSITPAPTYSDSEREVVYRALAYLAELVVAGGTRVLIDATAHRRRWRDLVRERVPHFAEVQLVCPLHVCRDRERARPRGHAPPGIYERAGGPGATVPGVDVPYEPPMAPELVIDTSAQGVDESASQVVGLARELERATAATSPAPDLPAEPAWALWIAGRPGTGKSTLARCVAERLRGRGARVHVLGLAAVHDRLLGKDPAGAHEEDIVHRVVAYAAKLLTEMAVPVIVDGTARRRVWREAARGLIPTFAEIELVCPVDICLERDRAVRWGLTFEEAPAREPARGPEPMLDYEQSFHADLVIYTDLLAVEQAADRVMAIVKRLAKRAGTGRG